MYIDVKIKKQVSAWAEPGPTSKHKNPVSHLLTPQLRAPWPGRVRGAAWHRARGSGRRDMSYGGSLHRPRRHTHRPNYSQFFGVKNIFYHKIFLRYSLDVFCFLNIPECVKCVVDISPWLHACHLSPPGSSPNRLSQREFLVFLYFIKLIAFICLIDKTCQLC